MQTALTYSSRAKRSVIGVAMVAASALPGLRPVWANPKHPR